MKSLSEIAEGLRLLKGQRDKPKDFSLIPDEIWNYPKISKLAFRLYCLFCRMCRPAQYKYYCYPSLTKLSVEVYGSDVTNKQTIKNAIKELRDLNLIDFYQITNPSKKKILFTLYFVKGYFRGKEKEYYQDFSSLGSLKIA